MEKRDIGLAADRIKEYVRETEIMNSRTLNDVCGCKVFLKLENFQRTGSFKIRGAANKLLTLTDEEKEKGVITASMGNHGEAVACMAEALGIECCVVVPKAIKKSKLDAIKRQGVRVEFSGETYDDAFQRAGELSMEDDYVMINSYEDSEVIAGNGTIALELPELDTVIVPVGSGGLLAGTLLALEGSETRVIGVEPEGAASMSLSLRNGKPSSTPTVNTIADGLSAKHPGIKPFNVIKSRMGEENIAIVSDKEIAAALLFLLERCKVFAEPSGAAPLAALMYNKVKVEEGSKVGVVITGGNMELSDLSYLITRSVSGEGRRTKLRIMIRDNPLEMKDVFEALGINGISIETLYLDRYAHSIPLNYCELRLTVTAPQSSMIEKCVGELREKGYRVTVAY
ncbi:MAG: pyridoxal-phosphate dependent enzyme [Candidatus Thermoplasmatota archaeon]|nr:pyridoxal-phosphate dependent enzyme [Candidatus Thermoplasmatota archaeon]